MKLFFDADEIRKTLIEQCFDFYEKKKTLFEAILIGLEWDYNHALWATGREDELSEMELIDELRWKIRTQAEKFRYRLTMMPFILLTPENRNIPPELQHLYFSVFMKAMRSLPLSKISSSDKEKIRSALSKAEEDIKDTSNMANWSHENKMLLYKCAYALNSLFQT